MDPASNDELVSLSETHNYFLLKRLPGQLGKAMTRKQVAIVQYQSDSRSINTRYDPGLGFPVHNPSMFPNRICFTKR